VFTHVHECELVVFRRASSVVRRRAVVGPFYVFTHVHECELVVERRASSAIVDDGRDE